MPGAEFLRDGDLSRMTPALSTPAIPRFPSTSGVRVAGCLGVLGLLSACAGSHSVPAAQEAAQYERSARSSYVAPGPASDPWGPYIQEASERYDIPERWIREVMRVESGGRTEMNGHPITSGAGAMGLMQVMPSTYDELRSRYSLGSDPYDPHNSILAGTAYIRELYDLYGSPGFLAAYNGGPGRLDDFLTRDRPLPDETRRYVAKIGPHITDTFPHKRSVAEQYAMNSLPANIPAGPRYPDASATAAYVPPAAAPVAPVPSAPVEVAYAPPSNSDGAFDPPPGWTPRAESRSAVAAPPVQSFATAAAEPAAEPDRYTAAPVPNDGPSSAYTPPPVSRPAYVAPNPAFDRPIPVRVPQYRAPERTQVAALPEPPPFTPSMQPAYAPQSLQHRESGFHLMQSAMAAPAPLYHGSTGQWAIQVGAFGNEGLAKIAVANAREQAASPLAAAHAAVAGVREPHGTLYRARLVGLSRDAAAQACDKLSRHTSCMVLSPEAQN